MTANIPNPKTPADHIAMKAAELLDRDIYDSLKEREITIRGARLDFGGHLRVETGFEGEGGHFKSAQVSEGVASVFRQALAGALDRRRDNLLVPILASVENEAFEAERRQAAQAAAERLIADQKRVEKRQVRERVAVAAYILLAGAIVPGALFYFREESPPAPAVNAYGFAKADFPSTRRWEYPAGCFPDDNRFSGLPDCKANLTRWESQGAVWVDWPEGQP